MNRVLLTSGATGDSMNAALITKGPTKKEQADETSQFACSNGGEDMRKKNHRCQE